MDSWSVLAVAGMTHVRWIDNTIPGCLAWAARMRDDGWTVSEPERWPGYGEPFGQPLTPVTVTTTVRERAA